MLLIGSPSTCYLHLYLNLDQSMRSWTLCFAYRDPAAQQFDVQQTCHNNLSPCRHKVVAAVVCTLLPLAACLYNCTSIAACVRKYTAFLTQRCVLFFCSLEACMYDHTSTKVHLRKSTSSFMYRDHIVCQRQWCVFFARFLAAACMCTLASIASVRKQAGSAVHTQPSCLACFLTFPP